MMGWVIAAGIFLSLILALIFVGRIPRAAWEITGAALLLGLAGYAWQGNPGLAGSPREVAKGDSGAEFDEQLAEQRRGMAERYGPAGQWLLLSDGLGRQGKTKESANVLLAGLKQTPNDPNLWLGLGNALVAHAGGVVSPGADFAYRRAMAIEPDAPAPRYFYGLALVRAGQLQAARELWAPLAESAPAGSRIKEELELNIARIDAMLNSGGRAQ
ncbi:MAG TPA: cytochrome C biosynthesis protein [Sphingobium sp.]